MKFSFRPIKGLGKAPLTLPRSKGVGRRELLNCLPRVFICFALDLTSSWPWSVGEGVDVLTWGGEVLRCASSHPRPRSRLWKPSTLLVWNTPGVPFRSSLRKLRTSGSPVQSRKIETSGTCRNSRSSSHPVDGKVHSVDERWPLPFPRSHCRRT